MAYDAGKLEDALKSLQAKPPAQAPDFGSYYYNLGTLSFQVGKPGQALAYLEKANQLIPHNSDIQHNLAVVHGALRDSLGNDRLDPASSWFDFIADQASRSESHGLVGLLCLGFLFFWARTYVKARNFRKTLFQPAGLLGLLALAIAIGLNGLEKFSGIHPAAIFIARESVRSGPGEHFIELAQAEAGSKVRLLGPVASESEPGQGSPRASESKDIPQEIWRQVRYSPDGIGWVRSSSILLL